MKCYEKFFEAVADCYLAPAQYLADRLCTGGPQGLPMLLILLIIVPPIFWLSCLSAVIFLIVWMAH